MDPRDRKLLELAGFKVEARGELFIKPNGTRQYVDPAWTLGEEQALAEKVADALIESWWLKSYLNVIRMRLFTAHWPREDPVDHVRATPIGRKIRAEAITAMLYEWLEEQP